MHPLPIPNPPILKTYIYIQLKFPVITYIIMLNFLVYMMVWIYKLIIHSLGSTHKFFFFAMPKNLGQSVLKNNNCNIKKKLP